MGMLLQIENLYKTFTLHILNDKRIEALRDVNLCIDEGEAIGLSGRSGSGKSTLMKCIYRTYIPTSGRMVYHSRDFGTVDLADGNDQLVLELRRREMTYCAQFLSVIPRLTAVEVVAGKLVQKGRAQDEAEDIARAYFERLNLPEELWDAYPSTFSGGEQQRINIAQAIIARPRFLLIDEPTASLDLKTKDVVLDMILELKTEGTSIVCITHDAHTLKRISDRVFQMEAGDFVQPAMRN
jgi:alpha-D-ribose 1-methylphosphonate 5-triphosphate synthase subunit PhnL